MRKFFFLFVFFSVILFQSLMTRVFPHIENYFFLPNLPLIFLAYVSLYAGPERGITLGFFLGFFEDSLSSDLMGINAFLKTIFGLVLGTVSQKFFVANRLLQFIAIIILTLFNYMGRELLFHVLGPGTENTFWQFIQVLFFKATPESIINGILGIIIFSLFDRWNFIDVDNH